MKKMLFQIPQRYRFSSKSQRVWSCTVDCYSCFRYHKGTDFQANHNQKNMLSPPAKVVLDTTKVQIFKQITTTITPLSANLKLFQIPQRYRFSSKSQQQQAHKYLYNSCFRYHKGTDFQANHNTYAGLFEVVSVVLDTTKVQIFKQITTIHDFDIPK